MAIDDWARAIASIESAGSGGYSALGPVTQKGNRAYGKYQVMDFNIGPWTEKYVGRRMTPQEFLASPEAQEAVFRGEFGGNVEKYGSPQEAASVWFTGQPMSRGANRKDILGTTGSGYIDKFNRALGNVQANYATPTVSTKGGQAVEPDQIKQDALAQSTGIMNMAGGQQRQAMGGQQPRQTMGERFRDPNFWNELALAFHSMSSFPNEAAIRSLESRVSTARERKKEQDQLNKTVAFFEKMGRDDLVQLAQVSPSAALNLYGQSTKPGYKVMTGAQVNQMYPGANLPTDKLFNVSPTGQITQVGGGGVNIDFGDKAQGKFAEEFAKLDAKTLADVFSTGITAQRNIVRIDRLSALLSDVETGGAANIKMLAGNLGINTEGLGDIQAAQALINSLVPEQRPAGSGPMSDADLELFKQSLPRIVNDPRGNQIIIQTLRGIAEYDMEGAKIIQRMRKGEISQAEAYDALMAREDPLAAFNKSGIAGAGSQSQSGSANQPQRRKFDASGNPVRSE